MTLSLYKKDQSSDWNWNTNSFMNLETLFPIYIRRIPLNFPIRIALIISYMHVHNLLECLLSVAIITEEKLCSHDNSSASIFLNYIIIKRVCFTRSCWWYVMFTFHKINGSQSDSAKKTSCLAFQLQDLRNKILNDGLMDRWIGGTKSASLTFKQSRSGLMCKNSWIKFIKKKLFCFSFSFISYVAVKVKTFFSDSWKV